MRKEPYAKFLIVLVVGIFIFMFGIKPTFDKQKEEKKLVTWASPFLLDDPGIFDVVVYGAEPSGISAALASARSGASTLLISESDNLGGVLMDSLWVDMGFENNDKKIYFDIAQEFNRRVGNMVIEDNYIKYVDELIKPQKKLQVEKNVQLKTVNLEEGKVNSLEISIGNKTKKITGRRFIDASRDGTLLEAVNIKKKYGFSDINLQNQYLPAGLNFLLDNVNFDKVRNEIENPDSQLNTALQKYDPVMSGISIDNFSTVYQGNSTVVVSGIWLHNIDPNNAESVKQAYGKGMIQAKNLTAFLKQNSEGFKDATFINVAKSLYFRGVKHFEGEYSLTVNDALENKDFYDKIAVCASPLKGYVENTEYTIGKPDLYAIPYRACVPKGIDNLLMAGNHVSSCSLTATSVETFANSINIGEALGIAAVFSITKKYTTRELMKFLESDQSKELNNAFARNNILMDTPNSNVQLKQGWAYPAVRLLNTLGLLQGGLSNDYRYDQKAKEIDFAVLLLNGIYRVSPEKYNLELDGKLRPYYNNTQLTVNKAAEMLLSLNGKRKEEDNFYQRACDEGYINEVARTLLKDKKDITLGDVYYLSVNGIESYTNKQLQ